MASREAIFAIAFLLERARREGSRWLRRVRLIFKQGYVNLRGPKFFGQRGRFCFVQKEAGGIFQKPGGWVEIAASRNSLSIDGRESGLETLTPEDFANVAMRSE